MGIIQDREQVLCLVSQGEAGAESFTLALCDHSVVKAQWTQLARLQHSTAYDVVAVPHHGDYIELTEADGITLWAHCIRAKCLLGDYSPPSHIAARLLLEEKHLDRRIDALAASRNRERFFSIGDNPREIAIQRMAALPAERNQAFLQQPPAQTRKSYKTPQPQSRQQHRQLYGSPVRQLKQRNK